MRNSIQKVLIDVREPVKFTVGDFAVLQDLMMALEPVKLVAEALCQHDTNIITAEAALSFCIMQLQK